MNNEQVEVIRRILELKDTVYDGIAHADLMLAGNKFESAYAMIKDVMEGLTGINASLETVMSEIPDNRIEEYMNKLGDSFEAIVEKYPMKQTGLALAIMRESLIPRYTAWSEEMNRCLRGYTLA